MKKVIICLNLMWWCVCGYAEPTISNLTVGPFEPWPIMKIEYDLDGATGDASCYLSMKANGAVYPAIDDFVRGNKLFQDGHHILYWEFSKQEAPANFADVTVSYRYNQTSDLYIVIDLSSGSESEAYPVKRLKSKPKEGWNDEYKTTKLVLRYIPKWTYSGGKQVRGFYIGVFEITQKQYKLVMGENPSDTKGDMKPVDSVSYEMIRGKYLGAQWPNSNNVDKDSFMGRLRSRTNISFDLPCTNMWICAATTVTPEQKYYWGNKKSTAFMWYYDNQNNTHSDSQKNVGEKIPNGYGLYDMLGNISEWSLDWSPRRENSRVFRVHCGGHYNSPDPTVLTQYIDIPSKQSAFVGFRVACPLMEE